MPIVIGGAAGAGLTPAAAAPQGAAGPAGQFADALGKALDGVAESQQAAAQAAAGVVTGEVQDIAQAVLASEKATLTLQLAVQIRNKLLEAYSELNRMPL